MPCGLLIYSYRTVSQKESLPNRPVKCKLYPPSLSAHFICSICYTWLRCTSAWLTLSLLVLTKRKYHFYGWNLARPTFHLILIVRKYSHSTISPTFLIFSSSPVFHIFEVWILLLLIEQSPRIWLAPPDKQANSSVIATPWPLHIHHYTTINKCIFWFFLSQNNLIHTIKMAPFTPVETHMFIISCHVGEKCKFTQNNKINLISLWWSSKFK